MLVAISDDDLRLAGEAAAKTARDEKPTPQEAAARNRIDAACSEYLTWRAYEAIPQKHWIEMSGRQAKIINEQAARYGIPFSGATVNLPAVVLALHDFLAANAKKLSTIEANLVLVGRKRRVDAELAELSLETQRGNLINRSELREAWSMVANLLRRAGEMLGRDHGADAQAILDEALDEADGLIEETLNK